MATVTATQLINEALRRADMVSGFIDTTDGGEAFEILWAAISELYDILAESADSIYLATEASFSTANGQSKYPIGTIAGATFYRLLGIDQSISGQFENCDRFTWAQRNEKYNGTKFKYALVGTDVVLKPTPTNIQSMKIWFLPLPPTPATGAATVDLQGPWREFVTVTMAIAFLEKEQDDTSSQTRRKMELEARIRAASKQRDSNEPGRVQDVQQDEFDPWWY